MNLESQIRFDIAQAVQALFNQAENQLQIQPTNKEFEGTHTLVCFGLAKVSKKSPEETAKLVGEYLLANSRVINKYNVVKGFLNLMVSDQAWIQVFNTILTEKDFGTAPLNGKELMVEYCLKYKVLVYL